MSEEENILIDSFLNGELTKNEQELFLKRMEQDPEFKEHVNFEKQLRETINPQDWNFVENTEHPEVKAYEKLFSTPKTKALQSTLENIARNKTTPAKRNMRVWYGIAALLIISLSVFSIFHTSTSPQKLYEEYYNPSELPSLVVRGATEEDNSNKVQQLFEEKNYTKTILLTKKLLATTSKNKATLLLFQGIAYTETKQYSNAIEVYDQLINSNLIDAEKGYWFKALTFLKREDIENAKKALKIIVENNYYNNNKARALLAEIE